MHPFLERPAWVFDLDGTLTVAAHDFEAIREDLGLPEGRPILESLDELSVEEQTPLRRRLAAIEKEIAADSCLADGAGELLEELSKRGARLGILTRNTRDNALITLEAVGLLRYFDLEAVLGRDEAPPKPDPAGVTSHLQRWDLPPKRAVMVGDFEFDLRAGRAAGTVTVYVDPSGLFPHRSWADVSLRRLDALLEAASQ